MRIAILLAMMVAIATGDDLDVLCATAKPPPLFQNHVPAFTVAQERFTQATAQGEELKPYWVVRDGGKAVAVLDEGNCQLDWIGPRPEQALDPLVLPRIYSWASLLGCRISTVAWIDGQGASGDTHTHAFEGGGATITLVVTETWTTKRHGESCYRFTLGFDPQLGYGWDIRTHIAVDGLAQRDGKAARDVELLNVQPGHLSDPWPDRWRFDRTVISLPSGDGFVAWYNNLVAGDRSDNSDSLNPRDGGLTAFLSDPAGWGLALVRVDRGGAERETNRTCNVWMDQHNRLRFPAQPDADGRHVIDARWRWVGLPPPVVAAMERKITLMQFNEKSVMLRLGIDETFDDQPLALDTPARGLWTWGLAVDGTHARSGSKALLITGVEKPDGNTGRFIAPFVPLDSTAAYRLQAWVWVEGGGDARFFMCSGEAKLEEGAMRGRSTNRVGAKEEWQLVSWDISKRSNVDLRLILIGKGAKAWMDDFSFKRIQ